MRQQQSLWYESLSYDERCRIAVAVTDLLVTGWRALEVIETRIQDAPWNIAGKLACAGLKTALATPTNHDKLLTATRIAYSVLQTLLIVTCCNAHGWFWRPSTRPEEKDVFAALRTAIDQAMPERCLVGASRQ